MNDDIEKGRVGGSLEDFLKDQGTYEATVDQAMKRVLAFERATKTKNGSGQKRSKPKSST